MGRLPRVVEQLMQKLQSYGRRELHQETTNCGLESREEQDGKKEPEKIFRTTLFALDSGRRVGAAR